MTTMETMNEMNHVPNLQGEIEKPYTLRKFKTDDIFIVVQILKKIGIKEIKNVINPDVIKAAVSQIKGEEETVSDANIEKLGFDIIMDVVAVVLDNLEYCRQPIYQLLANLSGKTAEQIADLDAAIFFAMVMDIFKMDNFKDFFKVALRYIK